MQSYLDRFDHDLLENMDSVVWKTSVELQRELAKKRRSKKWYRRLHSIFPAFIEAMADDLLQPAFWRVVYRLKSLERKGLVESHEKTVKTTFLSGTTITKVMTRYRLTTPAT